MKFVKPIMPLAILLLIKNVVLAQGWERTSLEASAIKCVEHSPWGILAGELSSSIRTNQANGLFLSKDLGNTWELLGLEGRGIEDVKYYDGKIYAATYYVRDNTSGVFVTDNLGESWQHMGISYSPVKIDRDKETIYFGTEHYGLWVSFDEGSTWIQKLGSGGDGTTVKTLISSENLTLVSSELGVHKSVDNGHTFEKIDFLSTKDIRNFHINGNTILALSFELYVSNDLGVSWEKVDSFGEFPTYSVTSFEDTYYVARTTPDYHFTVYKSTDLKNWEDTGLTLGQANRVRDITWIFSEPSYLFGPVLYEGLYRYEIPKEENLSTVEPFLEIPWDSYDSNDLVSKITSFFDHTYPLLGYYSEPQEEQKTTLNFYGEKAAEPEIYYSSHSGTDYGLRYGTEVRASAPGIASYFTCKECGHSIKIDHLNGYETKYMHLQENGLVTKDTPVTVSVGEIIGKVGMTGNTTGPHLHFEVTNGSPLPYSRVDPYGWLDRSKEDPWPIYSGMENSKSFYLWKTEIPSLSKLLSNPTNIYIDNLKLETTETDKTISIRKGTVPQIENKELIYIEGTSYDIQLLDQLGNKMKALNNDIIITISFGSNILNNVILNSIKVYFYDEIQKVWTALETTVDETLSIACASTEHLSKFALFGEKIQKTEPETLALTSGSQINEWFYTFPQISFYFNDNQKQYIDTTFYSISEDDTWEIYTQPFLIEQNGFINLKYRSLDTLGNLENTKNILLKINTSGKWVDKVDIKSATFSVSF